MVSGELWIAVFCSIYSASLMNCLDYLAVSVVVEVVEVLDSSNGRLDLISI